MRNDRVGGSRFVDIAGVTEGGIGALVIAGVLDADRYPEEWASVLFAGGGRIVGEKLRDAVGVNVRLESLLEKDVSDGGRRGFSNRTRVDDLRQREMEDVLLRGEWQGQDPAQSLLLGLSILLFDQTASSRSAHQEMRRGVQPYQSA